MKRVLVIISLHLFLFLIVIAYQAQAEEDEMWTINKYESLVSVSYTHLTLPTKA